MYRHKNFYWLVNLAIVATAQAVFGAIDLSFSNSRAHALTALGDATGAATFSIFDGNDDKDFWGIALSGGGASEFVQSVTFTFSNATVFDYDENEDSSSCVGIVAECFMEVFVSSLAGITASDITFVPSNQTVLDGNSLSLQFAPGSFGSGDSFRFAVDTDGLSQDGGSMGGVLDFAVVLEDGAMASTTFSTINPTISLASVDVQPIPFGFNASTGLITLGLVGLGWKFLRSSKARQLEQ